MPSQDKRLIRLAIVVSHPIQYYSPWFRWLAAHTSLDLRVFYLWDFGVNPALHDADFGRAINWDIDLLSGYSHEFVPNTARRPGTKTFSGLRNPGLADRLRAFAPDAILLFGYAYRTHLGLIARRAMGGLKIPLIFRGDSHLLGGSPPAGFKRVCLRFIYRQVSAFLPVGRANSDYFLHFGVSKERMFFAPHAVDVDRFTARPEDISSAEAQRGSLGISSQERVLLFSGKLNRQKRPDLLLKAWLAADVADTHLVLAGDGILESELRTLAAGHPRVHFLPFANQTGMPVRYLLSDVFALPSQGRYETWGLAVNEAMHLGRPAIVSDAVGCQGDLVHPGKTGWVFPAGDLEALTNAVRAALMLSRDELAALGRNARSHASSYSYAQAASGLLAALDRLFSVR
jgi:glycosyltransferase involved in cell wall biosynthesis